MSEMIRMAIVAIVAFLIIGYSFVIYVRIKHYLALVMENYEGGIDIRCNNTKDLGDKLSALPGIDTIVKEDYVLAKEGKGQYKFFLENGLVMADYPVDETGFRKKTRAMNGILRIFRMKKAVAISRIMDRLAEEYNPKIPLNDPIIYERAGRALKEYTIAIIVAVILALSLSVWAFLARSNDMVNKVKNATPEIYPEHNFGEIFDEFFDNPEWELVKTGDFHNVVEFTGTAYYDNGEETELKFQFKTDEFGRDISIDSLEIDGEKTDDIALAGVLLTIYEDYESRHPSKEKSILFENNSPETSEESTEAMIETYAGMVTPDTGAATGNVGSEEYIFPDSHKRYLTDDEIQALPYEYLRIARNEIYARYGRMFNDVDLQNYFNSCSWYTPLISPEDFSEDTLNVFEKANVALIRGYE